MSQYTNDLRVHPHILTYRPPKSDSGFIRWEVQFENGYGASVITGAYSYTDKNNPYELAVLHNDSLCYKSPITSDVIGHLNTQTLLPILDQIAQLPKNERCNHVPN